MTTKQNWFRTGISGVIIPSGVIVGLNPTDPVPENWELWEGANGYFLKGTSSDIQVGTTGARSGLSLRTYDGGGHDGGTSQEVANFGYYDYCSTNCNSPSRDYSSQGNHTGHDMNVYYRPRGSRLRLIRAVTNSPVPIGAVMFSTESNADQTLFSTFNSDSGLLEAGTSTGIISAQASASDTDYRSYSHDHYRSVNNSAWSVISGAYTSVSSSGPNHNHSGGNPSISHNLIRATVRAYEILDENKIGGLIGMWIGSGVPSGWELVASFDGKYLAFSDTGDGSSTGNNTVAISGVTGSSGHSHSYSGSAGFSETSAIAHSNTVYHAHSYSAGRSYEPERYYIKFIRYLG